MVSRNMKIILKGKKPSADFCPGLISFCISLLWSIAYTFIKTLTISGTVKLQDNFVQEICYGLYTEMFLSFSLFKY